MSAVKAARLDQWDLLTSYDTLEATEQKKIINEPDELGDTALHVAVSKGKLYYAKLLIAYGADVNAKNKAGSTPLHKCGLSNGVQVADCLIENNAQSVANKSGYTPCDYARENKDLFIKLIDKENPVVESIDIPSNRIALIIGQGGATLDKFRKECGTIVTVNNPRFRKDSTPEQNPDRTTVILKARCGEHLELAKQKITRLFESAADEPPPKKNTNTPNKKQQAAPEKVVEEKKGRKGDIEYGQYSIKVSVPAQKLKRITSKIEEIQDKTGVKIVIPTSKEDYVIVKGEPNQVTKAEREIKSRLSDAPKQGQYERKVPFKKEHHRHLIGSGGLNLRKISDKYGVTIVVPPADSKDENVIIRGDKSKIDAVIYDLHDSIPNNNNRGGGRGPNTGGRGGKGKQADKSSEGEWNDYAQNETNEDKTKEDKTKEDKTKEDKEKQEREWMDWGSSGEIENETNETTSTDKGGNKGQQQYNTSNENRGRGRGRGRGGRGRGGRGYGYYRNEEEETAPPPRKQEQKPINLGDASSWPEISNTKKRN